MMHTEEEAKTKWCPHVRAGNAPGCNRQNATDNCLGTECSQWRWANSADGSPAYKVTKEKGGQLNEPLGYCGLGGKP